MRFSIPRVISLVFSMVTTGATLFIMNQISEALQGWQEVQEKLSERGRKIAAVTSSQSQVPTTTQNVVIFSMDEIFANILSENPTEVHTLSFKLELDLFGEYSKDTVESKMPGIKDTIITFTTEQDLDNLKTLAGKLHFKERLIGEVNRFLGEAIVRDIHFSSFFLN